MSSTRKWTRTAKPGEIPELLGIEVQQEWHNGELTAMVLRQPATGVAVKIVASYQALSVLVPEPPKMKTVFVVTGSRTIGHTLIEIKKEFDEFQRSEAQAMADDLPGGKVTETQVEEN